MAEQKMLKITLVKSPSEQFLNTELLLNLWDLES